MFVTRTHTYVLDLHLCEVCQVRVSELIKKKKKVTETVFCAGTVNA